MKSYIKPLFKIVLGVIVMAITTIIIVWAFIWLVTFALSLPARPLPQESEDPQKECLQMSWRHSEVWMSWFGPALCKDLIKRI